MEQREENLRKLLLTAPHWQQLELQAFWYGLISWCVTCFEDKVPITTDVPSMGEILGCGDEEFQTWPSEWLEGLKADYLKPTLTEDDNTQWFNRLEILFQECVPIDLNIFSVFLTGEQLSESQWERMYETIAFQQQPVGLEPIAAGIHVVHDLASATKQQIVQPPQTLANRRRHHRTRHIHGRRAITPIRARKALTRKHKHTQPVSVVKLG
jgi:hypothetical protein